MKSSLLFLPLLLSTYNVAVTAGITVHNFPHKFGTICQETSAINYTTDCSVDLTIAIDMSSAMGNTANIATLTNSILTNFLPSFNFNETNTAGIAFGANNVGVSDYFNNYGDICGWIHSAEAEAIQIGLSDANLSAVFQDYEISLLHSGRNYKKVLALFTAISDPKEILTAKIYTDTLRTYGVYIIVGALAQPDASLLYQLGDYVFYSPDYTIPSFNVFNVTNEICQFGGITIYPDSTTPVNPSPTSSGPTDPRSNAIGTPCSTNFSNAWMDIVLVVDVSAAMGKEDLQQLAVSTAGYMQRFNIAQTGPHTTRAAIITYATDVTLRYSLLDVTNKRDLLLEFAKLVKYSNPSDTGVNVQAALKMAYSLLQNQTSFRAKAIILTAAAYDKVGFEGAAQTATTIKENGIKIFTVDFHTAGGVINTQLATLSSPGYSYIAQTDDIYNLIPYGLTQVNCFCPVGSLQFSVYDAISKNLTTYADCVWGVAVESLPSIVSLFGCDPGVMATVSSQEKLDFITDNILPYALKGKKQFSVGAHKSGTKWMWYGYNNNDGDDEFPLGNFPPLIQNSDSDQYTYFNKCPGFCFNFQSGGDVPRPYLCESRACDADFICDQTPLK
uniref:VWFA domain-containing protein n=1 Tax=Panagrolaimus superbus TaxID=310955 RepID=A0A914YWM4_9BILA